MSKKYRYEQLKPGDLWIGLRNREPSEAYINEKRVDVWVVSNNGFATFRYHGPATDGELETTQVENLYRRVEIEEREPLEGWVVKSPNGEPDYFYKSEQMELIDWEDYAFNRWCAESMRFMREVIPPEVKELPDCEGGWMDEYKDLYCIGEGLRIDYGNGSFEIPKKGEWIYLDPYLEQLRRDAE